MRFPATICPTIAVLIGSAGVSWSADCQKGLTAYKSGDYATALREWKPLAEQGNADAAHLIGQIYRNGKGVPRDQKIAYKWFRLSAEEGNAIGAMYLAEQYLGKGGVEENFVSGYVWALISLDSATKVVESKKNVLFLKIYQSIIDKHFPFVNKGIKEELTPAQIADAQIVARECVRKEYKGC